MRVAYDGTSLRAEQTGVGYYTEHLLQALATDRELELVVLSNRDVVTSRPLDPRLRFASGRRLPVRHAWMQLVAPRLLDDLDADVAHFTAAIAPLRSRVPTVLTIHDMSLELFPGYHPLRRRMLRPVARRSALRADAIITGSQSARRDILRLTGVPGDRIFVVPNAAAEPFRPLAPDDPDLDRVRGAHHLDRPFVLHVGTDEPRKNLPRLLEAYAGLRPRTHRLILAGAGGWGNEDTPRRIRTLGLEEDVRLLGYVPYADLPALYNLADLVVYPSIYEGFGLPVVEAMACGTPVVTSADSSLGEVAGDACELVDPRDVDSLRGAIERVLASPERRRELARRGIARAREFSWGIAARQTVEVYRFARERARMRNGNGAA